MRLVFSALVAFALGGVLMIPTEAAAMSKTADTSDTRILLRCDLGPGGDAVDPTLCAAVADALRAAQPRVVLTGDETPANTDLVLALKVTRFTDRGITARLLRETGGTGPAQTPPLGFDVMDRRLSPQMIARFAADLVEASNDLLTPTP